MRVPLVLALIVTAFFWKLLTKQYTWMDHPDMASQILPWLQYQADAWHRTGWFPLWDPNTWGGQPLTGQLVPGSTYPFNWPLFLLPFGSDGRIQLLFLNVQFILSHIAAAIFCYWLCRDLRRSAGASMIAGLAFSLTGMVGGWAWPQMLNSSIWMPLAMLYFHRSIVREQHRAANAALCGFFTGFMFLGGHHQIPSMFALLLAGMWAVRLWKQRFGALLPALSFSVLTLFTAGLQLIPAFEYGARSIRWVGAKNPVSWGQSVPYNVHQDFQHSFFPSGVLGLVLPNLSDYSAFLGLIVVTLALAGLVTGYRRHKEIAFIGAICIAGTLYALGGFSIFHGVAYLFVPMVEKLRTPGMAFSLAQFAIVVLAAYGIDALVESAEAVSMRWIQVLAGLGGVAWISVALAASVRTQTGLEYERPAIFGLMAFGLAGLLYARRSSALTAQTLLGVLLLGMLFEAGTVTGRDFHHRENSPGFLYELSKHRDLIDYLKAQPGFVRIEYDPANTIRYNTGDWDSVPQFESYLAGLTGNIARLKAAEELKPVLPKIFALTHFAGAEPSRPSTQEEVFQAKSGVKLFRNNDAFPRAWVVHRAVTVAEKDLVVALAREDLRVSAVLTKPAPQLASCDESSDEVSVSHYAPDAVDYRANLGCKGLVTMSETWYPGWSVTVDGAAAELLEIDGAIRGVVVDAGAHRIALRYRPVSVYLGASMSLCGLIAACSLLLRLR